MIHTGWTLLTDITVQFLVAQLGWGRVIGEAIPFTWMNEWGIYIALYCVLLYTQSALQSYEGVSFQPSPVCSIHLDDATAATGQRRQCAHHTPATGGEEREIEPIKWMGIIGRPWLTRASGGNLARTPGLHPYFTRSTMGFLMTTESQDLGLTSHPKDGALLTV